jgi:hypothetical protein
MTAVLGPVRATFRAVAATVVPETVALDPAGWATLEAAVEGALAARSERERRQLVLFLRLIEFGTLATHRGRFSRLTPALHTVVCRALERSPTLLVRRGFWGLRTLVFLGFYAQPAVQTQLGYRAHRDGWTARRRSGEHAAVPADGPEPA